MITRISITNLACFDAWESPALPDVVVIDGGNGAGKSSLLDVLKHLVGSGHDPDILRAGAEVGEAVVTFGDGNEARVRTTATKTDRLWRPKDGKRWINSRELIDKLAAAIDYDPLSFLQLKPKEQVQRLLQTCDVRPSDGEVLEAVGEAHEEAATAPIQSASSGLEMLSMIHKAIYDARRTLNSGADQLEAHAKQLTETLGTPAPEGQDWGKVASRLSDAKREAEVAEEKEIGKLREGFEATKLRLQTERDRVKAEADRGYEEYLEAARLAAQAKAVEVRSRLQPEIARLSNEYAVAQERAKVAAQAEGTRKAIDAARTSATEKKARSQSLTEALERIGKLKNKLAERLPIPGVTVSEGRIVREEGGALVPLSRWNTASQGQFCLRLAVINAKDAGFVCVDNIEHFEAANQEALFAAARKYAKTYGVQFLFARVRQEGGKMAIAEPGEGVSQ